MGTTLVWEPLHRPHFPLTTDLRDVLRKRFGDPIRVEMDERSMGYIHGLIDAGVEGAEKLVDAINEHKAILVKEVS